MINNMGGTLVCKVASGLQSCLDVSDYDITENHGTTLLPLIARCRYEHVAPCISPTLLAATTC